MKAFRFQIALNRPLVLKGESYSSREGILLEEGGQWAEASPLPGFSSESLEDVIDALKGIRPAPPSLEFALSALRTPFDNKMKVPWNGLLSGNRERVLADVESCIAAGCPAVKMKVGRGHFADEIDLVRDVRRLLPEHVKLRLDANRAWSFKEALFFIGSMNRVDFEYIEEPLQDPSELEELWRQTDVRYALDETLAEYEELSFWSNAAALICKPTIVGGRDAVNRLAKTGKPIVFSAAFESGVGIARIIQLAAEFSPNVAAGIDTIDWLSENLLLSSVQKDGGEFVVSHPLEVDSTQLETIKL